MNLKERSIAIELLRCAADLAERDMGAVVCAARELDLEISSMPFIIALRAWNQAVLDEGDLWVDDTTALLEAAQRLEEGSWP